MSNISHLTAYLAVSDNLPIIGEEFECIVTGIESNNFLSFTKVSITPRSVTILDNNIIKIKTDEPNTTYVVYYPTLEGKNITIGKIKQLPYLDSTIKYDALEFKFESVNDFSVFWKEYTGSKVIGVKKCANNAYFIITDNCNTYLLMKDNT